MEHFIEAFLRQAKQHPENIAVSDGMGSYSYGELNRRSAFMAESILRAIGPDRAAGRVALLLPRTKDFVSAWLAVLRSGFTVIPLSADYPAERVAAILRDSDCALCLTTERLFSRGTQDVPVILVDSLLPPGRELPEADLNLNRSRPEAEGMIFYTSGSTGTPKGVVHQQRILDACPVLFPQVMHLSSETRTLCIAMFSFVASLITLTPPLYYGGSLYVADENERKDMKEIYRIMKDQKISVAFLPPVLYGMMRRHYGPLPVEYLILAGEKVREQNMFGDPDIFEFYGASECPPMLFNPLGEGGPASLGRPFEGVTAFLAEDDGQRIQEPGIIGELCIATPYLALGYHKLPEETASKFRKTTDGTGIRYYCTGDYMAYADDGSLVFHGRKDRMVKIRGQRVELGEIDAVLGRYDGIQEASTVCVTLQGVDRLVCYYTGQSHDSRQLKEFAKKTLAEYMIPDILIHLEEMPRNSRSKTDYLALKSRKIDAAYLPAYGTAERGEDGPLDETEQKICRAFAKVLNLPDVGPEDSFFEIGGTSLLVMELSIVLEELNLSVKDIFTQKTPRNLARASSRQPASAQEETDGEQSRRLLPYQRYYVDYQLYSPKGDGANVPVLKAVPRAEIDPERLRLSVDEVLHHFSIFSTVFTFTDDGFVQRCEPERIKPVELTEVLDEVFEQDILPNLLKPHRVIDSLLYRCRIYVTETRVYLFMDFHHSIIDGTGLNLVMKNLMQALRREALDKDLYQDYLRRMELSAGNPEMDHALMRMRERYHQPSFDRVPRKDRASRDSRLRVLTVLFDVSYPDLMHSLSEKNLSLNMLFSASGLLAMKEYNGAERVQVQWIYHGRDEKWKKDVVGLTMSALPLAVDFGRPGLDLIKEVAAQIAENVPYAELSFALCDNSPGLHENLNMICEEGILSETSITPGTVTVPLWDDRHTSPADVECVLYPVAKENRLIMYINYNQCCYDEASMQRFGMLVAASMQRLSGVKHTARMAMPAGDEP